ncbi:MAG: type III pantothenate kinase [Eggerthellaceae bacterium]|nr:type III pantothenate kinase [Eggerthellaceae bacterium]
MLAAVDVGNTQTVIGIYDGPDLLVSWRLPTERNATPDQIASTLIPLMSSANVPFANVTRGICASVVPHLSVVWQHAISSLFGAEALLCTAESAGELFTADYPHPEEIGADRVADAVACKAIYGYPSIVVDFGTATNMEVIDDRGMFIGGIIAPGLETSAATLTSRASKLPSINLEEPKCAIGRNTQEAMESGIVFGEVARVEGLLRRIQEQLGYTATAVATGGLAPRIACLSNQIHHVDPELTLKGLRLISELNS